MEENIQQNPQKNKKTNIVLIITILIFIIVGTIFGVDGYKYQQANPNDGLGLEGLSFLGSLTWFFIAFFISLVSAIHFKKEKTTFTTCMVMLIISSLMLVWSILLFLLGDSNTLKILKYLYGSF